MESAAQRFFRFFVKILRCVESLTRANEEMNDDDRVDFNKYAGESRPARCATLAIKEVAEYIRISYDREWIIRKHNNGSERRLKRRCGGWNEPLYKRRVKLGL